MRIPYYILLAILLVACSEKRTTINEKDKSIEENRIVELEFQSIIDSVDVEGSILIYDFDDKKYYSNNFEWAEKGYLPASTFKITNSIIALETGVMENDSTLIEWDGEPKRLSVWEQDMTFKEAFHFSCVPCYQEIARTIGAKRMNEHLAAFEYGDMKVDSTNIDLFWLEGDSKISQFQQIAFLKKLYESELPLTERSETIIKRMIVIEENDAYKLSGKTGWSIRDGNNIGWFVGYIESQNQTYFFATNIEPKSEFDMDLFPMIRKEVTHKALKAMNIM